MEKEGCDGLMVLCAVEVKRIVRQLFFVQAPARRCRFTVGGSSLRDTVRAWRIKAPTPHTMVFASAPCCIVFGLTLEYK
jgi:hypothetical protein